MAYSWKILRASVEQEILFPSKLSFEAYIDMLEQKKEPYQIMKQTDNEDGTVTVTMRKRYNNNIFLEGE